MILDLFTLLAFPPCEGFLPIYLSGISYGWTGILDVLILLLGIDIIFFGF